MFESTFIYICLKGDILTCMKKEGVGVNLPSLNRFPGINLADKFFDKQTGKLKLAVPSESNADADLAVLYDFANLIVKKTKKFY